MYKLLLITDRDDIKDAFNRVEDWAQLMFHPVAICSSVAEGLAFLEAHPIDAMGYSMTGADVGPLHQYLAAHPSLPVFQTHKHVDTLRDELNRVRRFLDRMHLDDSDTPLTNAEVLQLLRDELMKDLLSGSIESEKDLLSRVKLSRANISLKHRCYVYEFDLPQGEIYLQDRWRYGADRLENALRNNFFGRVVDDIYYDVRVLTPRHIRVFACPRMDSPLTDPESLKLVKRHVPDAIARIKDYLDLDLEMEKMVKLGSLKELMKYR